LIRDISNSDAAEGITHVLLSDIDASPRSSEPSGPAVPFPAISANCARQERLSAAASSLNGDHPMNAHFNPSRQIATIIGYRHLCDQLEAENQVLRIQIQELRSRLCGRVAPAFAPLDSFPRELRFSLVGRPSPSRTPLG